MQGMNDEPADIARDVEAVSRIAAVPTLLQVLCEMTGMRFAAVARVTDGTWTACAVHDEINFGLVPGGQLELKTTLCTEVRASRTPIIINQASRDPLYAEHHTPRIYGIESYVSVPIVLGDGAYFGNLCAIDPKPADLSDPRVLPLFTRFADLIGQQLEDERRRDHAHSALLDERAASELREEFIAILGHDLRNPLAAISAYGQLLPFKSQDPGVHTIAAKITANVTRMSALIDDVVDFARGRLGGGMGVKMAEEAKLGAALAAIVTELQDAHVERRIVSHVDVQATVRCDRGRIQQLASNLLANALTHGSPGGRVEFDAHIEADTLLIEVWNDGTPIPAESMDKIFKPFWRRDTSAKREGLGLGLHICAQIVAKHGGQLQVSSTEQGGTRFCARIPVAGPA